MPYTKYKIPNTKYKQLVSRYGKFLVIFLVIFAWIFSGWPQIWEKNYISQYGIEKKSIPPEIQELKAASITQSAGTIASTLDGTLLCDDNAWESTTNSNVQNDTDDAVTDKTFDGNDITYRLDHTNFGFAIPDGSTIDGVVVEIDKHADQSLPVDYRVHLLLAGSPDTTQNKADITTGWPSTDTDTYVSYGGTTDKWGITGLSESDVENSGFGIMICAQSKANNAEVHIDHIKMTVYYTASSNTAPSVSNVTLNGGSNITLNEGTFKWATTSFLITDSEYCDTITSVTATAYRTATTTSGTTCAQNDNNCYPDTYYNACTATTTGNTCGASDTTVEYDCGFKFWYIADPTADNSAYAGDIWAVAATATDSGSLSGTATNTTETIEVNELISLDVTSSIDYGTLNPNQDTGNSNSTTTVTNTGNADMDPQISGTDMSCSGNTLVVGQQKYADAPFTYSSGGIQLTTSPTTLNLTLPNPTATTTAVTDDVSWGIGIPAGQVACDPYTGTNTFTATTGI